MFDRFKRTEPAERSSTGAVATADRPAMNDGTLAEERTDRDGGRGPSGGRGPHGATDRTAVDDRRARPRPTATPPSCRHRHHAPRARAPARGVRRLQLGRRVLRLARRRRPGRAARRPARRRRGGRRPDRDATTADVTQNAEEITLGGGIALLVALLIAYFSGGYVAGRMSRFDGARQGIGVWIYRPPRDRRARRARRGGRLRVQRARAARPAAHPDRRGDADHRRRHRARGDRRSARCWPPPLGGKAGERYHRRVDRAGFDT